MLEPNRKKWWWLAALVLTGWAGLLVWIVFFYSGTNPKMDNPPPEETVPAEKNQMAAGSIMPTGAKTPEEFMKKVQEKTQEIQRNYDSNLAEFAARKWKKIFEEYNGVNADYLSGHVKIIKQEVQKTQDQSTLFKVNYRIERDGSQEEAEDFFFLILSEQKKDELGLAGLRPNAFLSEEDIKDNIAKAGFAKITKIQK